MNNLIDFIGQDNIKDNLKVFISSSKLNNKILDHILIYGKPGMGKTTLAKLISNEINQKIKIVQGPEIQSRLDILNVIYSLKDGNILFIDEIHSINKNCFEMLYDLMDNFKININIGKDGNKKITYIDVPKFTIIGATTLLGNLPNPFEDRFGINLYLNDYSTEDIINILKSLTNETIISNNDIEIIAIHSKGIPRTAKKILNRVIDFRMISDIDIYIILKRMHIYEFGINEVDITYLKLLYNNDNMSLKSLSQYSCIDEKTILNKIEPYLFQIDFLMKTNRGRKLTNKALYFIEKNKIL